MKDFFDNVLEIGDEVAVNPPYYKGLVKGTVIRFSKKMVRIEYQKSEKYKADFSAWPCDVVKNPKEIL